MRGPASVRCRSRRGSARSVPSCANEPVQAILFNDRGIPPCRESLWHGLPQTPAVRTAPKIGRAGHFAWESRHVKCMRRRFTERAPIPSTSWRRLLLRCAAGRNTLRQGSTPSRSKCLCKLLPDFVMLR